MPSATRRDLGRRTTLVLVAAAINLAPAFAQETATAQESAPPPSEEASSPQEERSPWMFMPVASSNPKLGTSLGGLAGYLHSFDEKSRPSIFAVTAQYSDTDSIVAGLYGRMSFDEDHQRAIVALAYGNIKNDYDDYLGTGVPLRNEADLRSLIARYTYRVTGDWFFGGQGIYQNFFIAGDTPFDDEVLDIVGVQPHKAAGVGLVIQRDTRDNENMPTRGGLLNFNNIAFREALAGENNYDVYRVEFKYFIPQGKSNVIAVRMLNHLTNDAPTAARAPVQLRGYKVGEYTGKYMSSIEAEERLRFAKKWTATFFGGVACLYGDGVSCSDSENVFPMWGAGVQYILKPKEGIVVNLEYAEGKDNSYGIYLKLGYAF